MIEVPENLSSYIECDGIDALSVFVIFFINKILVYEFGSYL